MGECGGGGGAVQVGDDQIDIIPSQGRKWKESCFVLGGHTHTHVLFLGKCYPYFGFLVTYPLGFKARVGCLIPVAEANIIYIP